MTRENILFSLVGLFFGYCVAFTLVTYINLNPSSATLASGANSNSGFPAGHPEVPGGAAADQQELQNLVQQAEADARQKPKDYDAQKRAAIANMQLGDYDGAIDFWLRAKELRPDDYETIVQLGNNNFEAHRYETAERWYREALSQKPDDVNVHTDLGLTYFLRQPSDYDRAIAEYRTSLRLDPRHEPTLQNLTIAFVRKGNYADADATMKSLAAVNPENTALPTLRAELEKARGGTSSAPPGDGPRPPSAAAKGRK